MGVEVMAYIDSYTIFNGNLIIESHNLIYFRTWNFLNADSEAIQIKFRPLSRVRDSVFVVSGTLENCGKVMKSFGSL